MTARLIGDSMYDHSTLRGLPGALIEIRQDLAATPDQCEAWAALFARILPPILARAGDRAGGIFRLARRSAAREPRSRLTPAPRWFNSGARFPKPAQERQWARTRWTAAI